MSGGAATVANPIRQFPFTVIGEYTGQLMHGLRHPLILRSGATYAEAHKPLPGDELVPHPMWQATRGETIHAPAADIFPWLRQLGYGRGGWYAWFPLENDPIAGASCRSTDQILPQFQNLQVGDWLLDGPNCTPEQGARIVKSIESNRSVVLYAARQISRTAQPLPDFDPQVFRPRSMYFICSWAFVLDPVTQTTTRLLLRSRAIGGPHWLIFLMRLVIGNGDTVMQRTLMQRIKQRTEEACQRNRNQHE